MKNKFIMAYGIVAFFILLGAVLWFTFSVSAQAGQGSIEAEQSFSWISREATSAALSEGFMTDSYIGKMTDFCRNSRLLSALVISTPSGAVFAWPRDSASVQYDIQGRPQIAGTSNFMKVFSVNLDIGDNSAGSVVMTAVLFILPPDAIFNASRNSFLVVFTLLLVTLVLILIDIPSSKSQPASPSVTFSAETIETYVPQQRSSEALFPVDSQPDKSSDEPPSDELSISYNEFLPEGPETIADDMMNDEELHRTYPDTVSETESPLEEPVLTGKVNPEGLFSPVTGIGWESYLTDRLDAELIRAASSEQDLSLIILRVSGLLHTDLLSRKIAAVLLETFKFRDLVFEYGSDGFAGILQNINLDQAMKIADSLYAGIDSILIDLAYDGKITVGITTRTARLLPASRMIEEASSAARKAVEEPSLPIVAFRANPEKYRNYVADNN